MFFIVLFVRGTSALLIHLWRLSPSLTPAPPKKGGRDYRSKNDILNRRRLVPSRGKFSASCPPQVRDLVVVRFKIYGVSPSWQFRNEFIASFESTRHIDVNSARTYAHGTKIETSRPWRLLRPSTQYGILRPLGAEDHVVANDSRRLGRSRRVSVRTGSK